MSGFKQIESNPHKLLKALDQGPIVASIRAGNPIFKNYASGVIDSPDCNAKKNGQDMDHAVLIIGQGRTIGSNIDYFIIKNSFSSNWGEHGYARISASTMRSHDGVCGILNSLWFVYIRTIVCLCFV